MTNTGGKRSKILICDKNISDRKMLSKILEAEDYYCMEAGNSTETLKSCKTESPDIILLDLASSDDTEQTLLFEIRKKYPQTSVIVMATITELDVAVQSVKQGAYDYLTKPLDPVEVIHHIKKATLATNSLQNRQSKNLRYLENKVIQQAGEIREYFLGAMATLSFALEAKDSYTAGHSRRVADISIAIGKNLNLSKDELEDLSWGSFLHDLAKIAIDDRILNKPGKLSPTEYEHIMTHPIVGACLASSLVNKKRIIEIIQYHHAHYDGGGIRPELIGQEIPLLARIVAVADAYDAMTSNRPYRQPLSRNEALAEIRKEINLQFDPKIVEVFLTMSEEELIAKREIVLIADDDEGIRLLVKSIMSNYYLVVEATNGQEAVEVAQNQKPDIILMDILMPKKDGYQALQEIKNNPSTAAIPIVMLTAINQDLNKKLSINLGSNGYMTKPFTPQDLLNTIRRSIKGSK